MGTPADDLARVEQWAIEIVRTVIQAPDQPHATLQVMRLVTDMQLQIQNETIDEIGRRLHAVPTSKPASRPERKP